MTIQKLFTAETITYYNFISFLEKYIYIFLGLSIASFLHLFEFSLYSLLSVFVTFHGFSVQFSIFELNEVISQILVFPWRCSAGPFQLLVSIWMVFSSLLYTWHPGVYIGIYLWMSVWDSLLPISYLFLSWFFSHLFQCSP